MGRAGETIANLGYLKEIRRIVSSWQKRCQINPDAVESRCLQGLGHNVSGGCLPGARAFRVAT